MRGSPAPFSDGRFWALAPFWIPRSFLDGQGSCQFFKILQVAINGHLSLELVLYSRPVSMELGFSLYDALETINSLGSDVTLTCLVVICLLLNLMVIALLNWRVGLSYRTASPAYFSKPCNSYDRPGVHTTPRTGLQLRGPAWRASSNFLLREMP